MVSKPYLAVAILLFFFSWLSVSAGCDIEDVAVYKMTLRTLWSAEKFPKDYPLYRPKAQWSQVFGQSHNSSYALYRLGDTAREAVRKFSQFGHTDTLIQEGDEETKVYDQFAAPPIGNGEGETENMVFVDGGHSLVSLICRMIPSPDWFVGVDSVNLCVDSNWIEQITLDLEPLDAGAASGFTFTAPRWETSPPEAIARHGPKSPNHPAAGFYYPELRELPAIAKVKFSKVKEYSTKELNKLARKELITQIKTKGDSKKLPKTYINDESPFSEDNEGEMTTKNYYIDHLKELEEEPVGTPKPYNPDNIVEVITKASATTTTTTEPEFGSELHSMDDVVLAVAHGRKLGLGKHLPRHFRSRLHHAVNKLMPNDCLVSDWGEWTPCSVTCGFGDKFRTRQVLREPTEDGRACPKLTERTHCGNVNSCWQIEYFDW